MSNSRVMDPPLSATVRSADRIEIAFVAGEAWAFEAAYVTYRRLLYGAAFGVLRDDAEAEDCVHDVLLRLWRKGHAYSPSRGSLAAFLAVCVRNDALSRRRKQSNRVRIERERIRPGEGAQAAADLAIAEQDRIETALQSLNDSQRDAIRMAYYDGFTHEEIARRTGEPLGTIKSRLANGLRVLRAHFAARGEGS